MPVVGKTLWNQRVPVRDGTEIAVDVMLPPGDGPFPTVVTRTPYMRGAKFTPAGFLRLLDSGYAYVAVDIRGRGDSDGVWRPFVKDPQDAHDVVEWIAEQEWSTGNVGMVGGSYEGLTQWWTAAGRPPHLRCIAPMAIGTFREGERSATNTGIPTQYWMWWMYLVLGRTGQHPGAPAWEDGMMHLPLRELDKRLGLGRTAWQQYVAGRIDYLSPDYALADADFAAIDIPVLVVVGWWDDQHTMSTWCALQNAKSSERCRLLIGAWDHAGNMAPRTTLGGLDVRESAIDTIDYIEKFLALHLKGETNELSEAARCRLFRTGEDEWESVDDWPAPAAAHRAFYLSSDGDARSLGGDGRLTSEAPPPGGGDTYTFDPNDPGRDLTNMAVFAWSDPPLDARYRLRRGDVLVYTSEPLTDALRVSGRIEARIAASSDRADTDLFLNVFDVHPDGRTIDLGMFAEGLRLSQRDGPDARPLEPGAPVEVTLPGPWVHHTFKRGHRLRVSIHSCAFTFKARNGGTMEHWADQRTLLPQTNTVWHGASRILVPVEGRTE